MRTLLSLLLIAVAGLGLLQARRHLIRSWFVLGPAPGELVPRGVPEKRPPSPAPGDPAPRLDRQPRTRLAPLRVLLVDGLRADVARGLPAFSRLCAAGVTLRLDVGFPSVSLPVQHALWTGLWQQQSGVQFIVSGLPRPLFPSLPGLVTERDNRALAVAEAHREIVASFPFSAIIAPEAGKPPLAPARLTHAALSSAASDAALVLIHTLAVDAAGHRGGPLSPAYRAAARASDQLLAALWQARRPDWTLAALSDHGHRLLGGHGDVEPEVRFVTACLAGPGLPGGAQGSATVVELHQLFAERLGLAPPLRRGVRTLEQLLASAPAASSQPARCSLPALTLALLFGGALLLGLIRGLRRIIATDQRHGMRLALWLGLPWSLGLALLLLSALGGLPSLSAAYVYPARSPLLLISGALGALVAGLQLWGLYRAGIDERLALWISTLGLLAPTVGALLLTGWPWLRPALCPYASGWASTLTGLSGVMLLGLALAGLALRLARR